MAREKPILAKLHELTPGQPPADVFALLADKQLVTARGRTFYRCKFRDRRRTVECAVWSDAPLFADCERAWAVGTIYKLRAHYSEHERYGPVVEIFTIRESTPADGLNPADFSLRSRHDPDKLLAELVGIANDEIRDAPLRQLILNLYEAHAAALKRLPASPRAFYPFPGGWLEHVAHVTKNCLWLADQYAERFPDLQPFNRDLVVAGALLHEIGRVAELAADAESPEPTVDGQLFGAVILGRDLVREAARAVPDLDAELLRLLDHLLLAYLTKPEWGSPRLPMIPEALILHNADDLDAKFEMYARHLTNDQKTGPVTETDPVLKRPLLKGRTR
jgi:3'-5' exoribonuclease